MYIGLLVWVTNGLEHFTKKIIITKQKQRIEDLENEFHFSLLKYDRFTTLLASIIKIER